MWYEGRGGGTGSPWITVHAGPQGAHPMIFHVTQDVWDYVMEHGLDLVYNRKLMQGRLDAIKTLLESPPVQTAVASVQPAVSRGVTLTPLGWVLAGGAVVTAGVAVARRVIVGRPRRTPSRPVRPVRPVAPVLADDVAVPVDGDADTIPPSPSEG